MGRPYPDSMNPDLRQDEDPSLEASVDADERRAAERRVAWYFGDLLDNVTAEYPVARHRLVGALAALDAAARAHEDLVDDRGESIEYETTPGRVVRLPLQLWDVFAETEDLKEEELRAARAVHRRMAVALIGAEPEAAAPSFVLAAESPY